MKRSFLYAGLLVAAMISCGKKIPSDVIQPEQMENLLYDYHLATTMGNTLPYDENYTRKAYLEYVFRKHGTTEAEFDSSMVWYTRHTKELTLIYERLQKRYEADELAVRKQVDRQSGQIIVSMSGDTVDIWRDRPIHWLTASPLTNKLNFDLKADTSFRPKDVLAFRVNLNFMPLKSGGNAVMGLRLTYKNDSVQGQTRTVTSSGVQTLYLRPDSAFEFKEITGFIYYEAPKQSSEKGHLLVSDIHLYRYHQPEPNSSVRLDTLQLSDESGRMLPADSLPADSSGTASPLVLDTLSKRNKRAISPMQR